jgi:WD40 repeat protein
MNTGKLRFMLNDSFRVTQTSQYTNNLISLDNNQIASSTTYGLVSVWDLNNIVTNSNTSFKYQITYSSNLLINSLVFISNYDYLGIGTSAGVGLVFYDKFNKLTKSTTSYGYISVNSLIYFESNYIAHSVNSEVIVWDLSNGNFVSTSFVVHPSFIRALLYLDNFLIASASDDGLIKICHAVKGFDKYEFNITNSGHTNKVNTLIKLENGLMASGSNDKSIKIWNYVNGTLEFTFNSSNGGHLDGVTCLLKLNSLYLVSGSYDYKIKIWDPYSGVLLKTFDQTNGGHHGAVNVLTLLNSTLIASGSADYTIRIWDLSNFSLKYTLDSSNGGHNNEITSLLAIKF